MPTCLRGAVFYETQCSCQNCEHLVTEMYFFSLHTCLSKMNALLFVDRYEVCSTYIEVICKDKVGALHKRGIKKKGVS